MVSDSFMSLALLAGSFSVGLAASTAAGICEGATGPFKCVSQFSFVICNGEQSVAQMVSAGTQCVNDQIVYLSYPYPSNSTNETIPTGPDSEVTPTLPEPTEATSAFPDESTIVPVETTSSTTFDGMPEPTTTSSGLPHYTGGPYHNTTSESWTYTTRQPHSYTTTSALETSQLETSLTSETSAIETSAIETSAIETSAIETSAIETSTNETPINGTPTSETSTTEASMTSSLAITTPGNGIPTGFSTSILKNPSYAGADAGASDIVVVVPTYRSVPSTLVVVPITDLPSSTRGRY